MSTTEAKYIIVSEEVKDGLWLRGLVGDLGGA